MALFIIIGVSGMTENVCEADTFPNLYENGVLVSSKLSSAHQACINHVEQFMMAGIEQIAQANTNLDVRSIKPYIELAKEYKYKVHLILPKYDLLHYPLTDTTRPAQIAALVNARSQGDKIVPCPVIQRMITQYDALYPKLAKIANESDPGKLLVYF